MNFTCFMIASHPEVQRKLHEEVDRVFGRLFSPKKTFSSHSRR